jgi:hypothetical protein
MLFKCDLLSKNLQHYRLPEMENERSDVFSDDELAFFYEVRYIVYSEFTLFAVETLVVLYHTVTTRAGFHGWSLRCRIVLQARKVGTGVKPVRKDSGQFGASLERRRTCEI